MPLKSIKNQFARLTPTRFLILGYTLLMLLGAGLLSLPIASRSGESAGFLTALFTSTSAVSVTGLVLVDTYTQWSIFGQIVILLLIQIGGLGFMFFATFFSLLLGRRIAIKERLLIAESFNIDSIQGIVRLTKRIILGTVMFQTIGAVILSWRYIGEFGWIEGIYRGVFHAISAFCNAGFDLMGYYGPFSGMTVSRTDFLVNLTVMVLIILGSIGFTVWNEVFFTNREGRLSLYSRIVLITTGILIVSGGLLFWVLEAHNPRTLATLPFEEQALASSFAAVSHRTAGLNTINIADLTGTTLFITMLLMFIGGASDSSAGGIKVTTLVILLTAVWSSMRHRKDIELGTYRLNTSLVLKSLTIFTTALMAIFTGIVLLTLTDPSLPFKAILFEVISAFGTVGLSMGITSQLSTAGQLIIILLMFLGKVGVLSLGFALATNTPHQKTLYRYPKAKLFV